MLDTNVLVLWIVGNLNPSRVGARRLEAFQPQHLEVINEIVAEHSIHVSTPNVLTEASNFIGSGDQQLCAGACDALGRYIARLDEVYIESRHAADERFYHKLGLADAGMAVLARKGERIVTADGPMYAFLSRHGLSVENFWHRVALN